MQDENLQLVNSLKVRLFDTQEQVNNLNQILGTIAQKVGFNGEGGVEALIQAIPEKETEVIEE